ncbi:type II toxin-antitoxin system VapC family toxin [Phenylobacterium sp.]|uniref:type II toxin-antitoxin system VapC family toxin n=1 Tax=Phenylobacterium sp. TaxID=1871053 RepID=UPI002DF621A1|nr:type II toxin-antitoxin system VapC family toxin [Phenylobacterium sp.]
MIAVDASAVLAILFGESEEPSFSAALERAGGAVIGPVNYWEVLVRVHSRQGSPGVDRARHIMDRLGLRIGTVDLQDADRAYGAFARFGKGIGGPLNLGDCFAYALAELEGDGLLFKGDDFPKTDVKSVLA